MILFTLRLIFAAEQVVIPYESIDQCLQDRALANMLDQTSAVCELWCGDLKIVGKPIASSAALRETIVYNARTLLHPYINQGEPRVPERTSHSL